MTVIDSSVVDTEVHGAFSFLDTVFVNEPEPEPDSRGRELVLVERTPAPPAPRRTWAGRLAGVLRATKAALTCVREALAWLVSGVGADVRRRTYPGRHHITKPVGHRVRTTLLGRDRSTSEYSQIVQRRCREAAAAQEDDLAFRPGDTFVDWLSVAHDSLRYVNFARKHNPAHGRWACS